MLDIMLRDSSDYRTQIASRAREKRLSRNMTQQELAKRTGVSLGSIKRFETTGLISLSSLLEIALVLDSLPDFDALFAQTASVSDLYNLPTRKQRSRARATGRH